MRLDFQYEETETAIVATVSASDPGMDLTTLFDAWVNGRLRRELLAKAQARYDKEQQASLPASEPAWGEAREGTP